METTLEDFYQEMAAASGRDLQSLLPGAIDKEIGHFNVFALDQLYDQATGKHLMPYSKRAYYKISLIEGCNRAEYADKVIEIDGRALLFATPKIPYNWIPQNDKQSAVFCVFTPEFLSRNKTGVVIDELPIFSPGQHPIFQLSETEAAGAAGLFERMQRELSSDYKYKYDLLRNMVMELIHFGQKLQPASKLYSSHHAGHRISSLFIELLERQFPIESQQQRLLLRTAGDYANRLAVHINHLNKVLRESTGKTTTEIIGSRIIQEAKILLRQTDWNVSEIAWVLGFEEIAHFSNFFKRQTGLAPQKFRSDD
ncbi:AraC family transcriptional regulator [Pedobacter yulinensis]|uniref:AraC family transcriptional regulator n=1 Tax=Pedobacter yulinensis TaxID=2126353 RepID=A0A2T3HNC2_9SPHI|nr:helix-turn-helix transcriptional regulator [Pedobacter yulinensis]PST83950.1 AraC family transcriptional regulator [Pedobacter yulinensis]